MNISDQDRGVLRKAWEGYCTALREAGLDIIEGRAGDAADPQELAEALRAVARIGIMALQHRMDFNDPDFPVFFRTMDDRFKYGGPDAYVNYITATLRGGATYRLRANHHHREFNMNLTGLKTVDVDGDSYRAMDTSQMWPKDMDIAPDGSFEVTFSAEQQPGNWMRLDPSFRGGTELPDEYPMAVGGLLLRTYYWNPDDGLPPGEFIVERIDDQAPLGPAPLTPTRFAEQVDSAAELCTKGAQWWIARAARIRVQNEANVIAPPGKNPPGIQRFSQQRRGPLERGVCAFDLGPDEALFIESDVPITKYWSFTLYNAWWESPDVQDRQTSITFKHAHLDGDGRFRAVIAHADPGVPNWLDTGGARRGFLFYRWLWPETPPPAPVGRVVKFKDIRGLMPAGHPAIDEPTRRKQLSARRAAFARRFQT